MPWLRRRSSDQHNQTYIDHNIKACEHDKVYLLDIADNAMYSRDSVYNVIYELVENLRGSLDSSVPLFLKLSASTFDLTVFWSLIKHLKKCHISSIAMHLFIRVIEIFDILKLSSTAV